MCNTKITRDNFKATFGGNIIHFKGGVYISTFLDDNCEEIKAGLFEKTRFAEYQISADLTTLGQVHALYKALMLKDFEL